MDQGIRESLQKSSFIVFFPDTYLYMYDLIYIYGSVSRVANPPPTPHGMGPKPTFWLHFHGTRQNTWYLQCFDKLGLRNRVFAAFCNTTLHTTTLIIVLLLLLLLLRLRLRINPHSKSPPPPLPQGGGRG